MFNTIVLALDGSEGGDKATPVAVELARKYGAKLVIVHVDERIAAKGDMPPVHANEEAIQEASGRRPMNSPATVWTPASSSPRSCSEDRRTESSRSPMAPALT